MAKPAVATPTTPRPSRGATTRQQLIEAAIETLKEHGYAGASARVIADVVQKVTLDVTPWGTEATAATGIGAATSASRASVALEIDHPFLFLIRDTHTGVILFEAQINILIFVLIGMFMIFGIWVWAVVDGAPRSDLHHRQFPIG